MLIKLLMTLAIILLTIVYLVFETLPFHLQSTAEMVHKLPVLIIPAYYTFFIRFVVLIGYVYWAIQHVKKPVTQLRLKQSSFFISAVIFSFLHLYLWHIEKMYLAITMLILSFIFLFLLYQTCRQGSTQRLERIPISLAVGWTFFLILFDFSYLLVWNNVSIFHMSAPLLTVILLTISTAFVLHFIYHDANFTMGTVFIWTFIGIIAKNKLEELLVSSSALFLILVILALMLRQWSLVQKEKSTK